MDKLEQYSRREILNFLEIPLEGTRNHPENTTIMIINFLRRHFNLQITPRDISVSHRTVIPSDKSRLGRNYIPPIYCKFLNRSLVHEILRRRKQCLRNVRNRFGKPFWVEENLTPTRRLLWESVQSGLQNFRFKWIRSGDIYVKKADGHLPVKITSDDVMNELASAELASAELASETNAASSVHQSSTPSEAEEGHHHSSITSNNLQHQATRNQGSAHLVSKEYAEILRLQNAKRDATSAASLVSRSCSLSSIPTSSAVFKYKKKSLVDFRSTPN